MKRGICWIEHSIKKNEPVIIVFCYVLILAYPCVPVLPGIHCPAQAVSSSVVSALHKTKIPKKVTDSN